LRQILRGLRSLRGLRGLRGLRELFYNKGFYRLGISIFCSFLNSENSDSGGGYNSENSDPVTKRQNEGGNIRF
jgi:hypothetical protein